VSRYPNFIIAGVALLRAFYAGPNARLLALLRARRPDLAPPPWLAQAGEAASGHGAVA